ncbi:MAG: transcriptional regulator [Hyphomicrobiales bacterium]|nr:MAG: transcriptional regulator [Hyphomicrobiales bacterium]
MKLHKASEPADENICDSPCPVSFAMSIIGGKWKCVVLFHLVDGPKRFGVLRRSIPGITQRMLTLTLRELEADDLVNRKVFEVVPPHVEYSLTTLADELQPVMESLAQWGEHYYKTRVEKDDMALASA